MARVRRHGHNRLEFPGVVLKFQRYPGSAGTDADRGISGVEYRVTIDGHLWQMDTTTADGGVSVPMPPGYDRFTLRIFDVDYNVTVLPSIDPLAKPSLAGSTIGDAIANLPTVKRRLELAGHYMDVVDDDTISAETEDAILRLQADAGLTPDGLVGDQTKNAIASAVGER